MMTRKDYKILASALDQARSVAFEHDPETVRSVAALIAVALYNDNPRFDAVKFFAACGQNPKSYDGRKGYR